MTCPIADQDSIHRYVAGTLPERELEDFETHLLGCAACRAAVREGATLRRALRESAASTSDPTTSRMAPWPRVTIASVALALAAGIVLVVVLSRRSADPLAAFVPPTFSGVAVRGSPGDSVAAAIDRGMAAYTRGDFRAAARELGAASVADSSAGVAYYWAVALLASGDASRAIAAARRAYMPPYNPFAGDAHLVAAKAWLRGGHADSAIRELGDTAYASAVSRRRAGALLDSLARQPPR